MNYVVDPALKQWATDKQSQYIDLVNEHGSAAAVEKSLGLGHDTIAKSIRAVKKKAASKSYAPEIGLRQPVPDPYIVKRLSVNTDADDNIRQKWVISEPEKEKQLEVIRDLMQDWASEIPALPKITKPKTKRTEDLLSVYPMGDPHFGMFSWGEETGEDFDLKIAEKMTMGAIDRLVESAPPSKEALLINLGDFFHADNSSGVTPKSGNKLDTDSRHAKVLQVGFRAIRYAAMRLLEKHEKVTFWSVRGNHDEETSFALAMMMDAFFHDNPRIEIPLTPGLFHYYRFGKVLIGAHHGHAAKMQELPGIMAYDRKEDWGSTDFRYWYIGHVHHTSKQHAKEYPGVEVETFRTLAASDAWHKGQGYRSGRDMRLIVHHKEYGFQEMHRCDASQI